MELKTPDYSTIIQESNRTKKIPISKTTMKSDKPVTIADASRVKITNTPCGKYKNKEGDCLRDNKRKNKS